MALPRHSVSPYMRRMANPKRRSASAKSASEPEPALIPRIVRSRWSSAGSSVSRSCTCVPERRPHVAPVASAASTKASGLQGATGTIEEPARIGG